MNFTRVQDEGIRCLETQSLGRKRKPLQGVAASGSGVAPRRRPGRGRAVSALRGPQRQAPEGLTARRLLAPWLCPLLAGLAWQAPVSLPPQLLEASAHRSMALLLTGRERGPWRDVGLDWATRVLQGKPQGFVLMHTHEATQHRFRGQDVTSVRALTLPATRPE